MSFSLDTLQAFVQAAHLGSFSAAARHLGKRQSTISEAIARLEIDTGLSLFDRSARHPVLTDAGRALLGRAEALLKASDRLEQAIGKLADGTEASLTLVLSDLYPMERAATILQHLDRCYPELYFEYLIAEESDTLELVRRGRAHLGVVAQQPGYPPEVANEPLASPVDFGLFVSRQHPLAKTPRPQHQALNAWRQLRLAPFTESRRHPSSDAEAGTWSAPNYLLLLEMAVAGMGWAALPRWMVSHYDRAGALVELPLPTQPTPLALDLIWQRHRRLGPASQWLCEQLLATT